MATKHFSCERCEAVTLHERMSAREYTYAETENYPTGDRIAGRVGMTIAEAMGGTQILALLGAKFWKCTKCGLMTRRNPGGRVVETVYRV